MNTYRNKSRIALALLAFAVGVAPVFAADESKDEKDDPVHGQTRSDAQGGGPSSHISKAILSTMPSYNPNPPKKAELPEGMTEDDVVVLDPVTVRERKQPRVKGWDMLTDKGRDSYLRSRYRGAATPFAPLASLSYNYAALMNSEDIRVENLQALQDLVDSQRAAGTSGNEMKELDALMNQAKMLPTDFKSEAMDKSTNGGRR